MVWMIYGDHMITGDEFGPNFLTFALRLRENPEKNLKQETSPTGDRTRARCMRSNDVQSSAIVVVVCYLTMVIYYSKVRDRRHP